MSSVAIVLPVLRLASAVAEARAAVLAAHGLDQSHLDALSVLRRNGPKATAYGVHGTTAAVLLGTAALLFSGPE